MGNFIFALERLNEKGLLLDRLTFLIGQNPKVPRQKKAFTIAVGQCASKQVAADFCIDECPPSASNIYQTVISVTAKR
jgi:hypothetical protein